MLPHHHHHTPTPTPTQVLMKNMYRMLHEPPRYAALDAQTERGRANKRRVSIEQRELMLKRINEQNAKMLKIIVRPIEWADVRQTRGAS